MLFNHAGTKCSQYTPGEMKARDIVGCGGGIEMKCRGGCLKIHKTLYSCKMKDASIANQIDIVKELCEEKESCTVQASREVFGNKECPDSPDSKMNLWVTYSCDGGTDRTKVTGPKRCPSIVKGMVSATLSHWQKSLSSKPRFVLT